LILEIDVKGEPSNETKENALNGQSFLTKKNNVANVGR